MACDTSEAHSRVIAILADTFWAELVRGSVDAETNGTPSNSGRIEIVMAVVFEDNSDGTATNTLAAITWPAPAVDDEECPYLELWTDQYGGTRRFYSPLANPVTPTAGQATVISVGHFTWSEL